LFQYFDYKNKLFYFVLDFKHSQHNTVEMKEKITQIRSVVLYNANLARERVEGGLRQYWLRFLILGLIGFMITRKDLSINLSLNAAEFPTFSAESAGTFWSSNTEDSPLEVRPMNTSLLQAAKARPASHSPKAASADDNLANTFSNLNFEGSEKDRKRAEKRKKQLAYIRQYKAIATAERDRYGIPVSITLAQGLLESNVGESKLAKRNNNHFGIKCFSRTCRKGHCSNFTDDSHKDFFRKYKTDKDSYRAHSLLLKNGKRYRGLFKLKNDDYKGWARGLSKAGYATDKRYAQKIIRLIEDLKLYKYD
jgi:flagellum-specific peptidoglycan hydrolase FlgJ